MIRRQILMLAAVCAMGCAATVPAAKKAAPKAMKPPIPAEYKVKFETTKGDVIIQVHHDWAPLGADHFYELVTKGYYDNNAFFRAIKGFMVQFGMNGDPKVTSRWNTPIKDDPPHQKPNKTGAVTFAQTSMPNSRTTHIFINLNDNAEALDSMGFIPFGEVISGMENVSTIYTGYGDAPPNGTGPDQEALTHGGNAYLQKSFPNLDYIKKATVIDPPPPPPAPAKPMAPARKAPVAPKRPAPPASKQ
jgi:peptidyl-prolyl cis-trans isomerase A (cyclophilin A)